MEEKVAAIIPVPQNLLIPVDSNMFCNLIEKMDGVEMFRVQSYSCEHAKNTGINLALKGDFTHLFILDADVAPPDDALERLLSHNKDFVAGIIPVFKEQNGKTIINWDIVIKNGPQTLPETLFLAGDAGGSTLLVKREVFEAIGWPWFKTTMTPEGMKERNDSHFSRKATEAGYELWIDPTIRCQHYQYIDLLGLLD